MIHKFKKQISFLFAGSFSLVFAACYGMPVDMEYQKSIRAVNENNEAIPGLQVQLTNNDKVILSDISNENGDVYYSDLNEGTENNYKIIISDIDSTENGGPYAEKLIDIVDSINVYTVNMNE